MRTRSGREVLGEEGDGRTAAGFEAGQTRELYESWNQLAGPLLAWQMARGNGSLGFRQTGPARKLPRKRPTIGGLRVKKSHLGRETGIEPATLCLEGLGFAIRISPSANPPISE
jgi:hypothetical protein